MSTFARSRAWTLTGLCALLASQPCAGQAIPTPEAPRSAPMVLAQSINIPIFEFRLPRPAPPETRTAPAREPQPIARPTTFKVPKTGAERRALFERLPGSAELRQYFITDTDTFIDTLALLATSEKTPPLLDKAFADFHVSEAVSAYVGYFNGVDPRKARPDDMPANTLAAFELVTIYVVYAGPDGYAKVKPLLTPPTSKNVLSATAIMCPVLLNSHSIPECSTRAADYDAPAKDTMVASDTRPKFDLPPLMQGGADRVFDILGIAPGMGCDAARSQMRAQVQGAYGQPSPASRTKNVKIAGANKSMETTIMALTGAVTGHLEKVWVECSSMAAGNQVYLVWRSWEFINTEPLVDQLKASLEEKYGQFSSVFARPDSSYVTYAILYNMAGQIKGPDDSCGRFLQNMPEAAIAQASASVDVDRCSFALSASFELKSGDKSRVRRMLVTIWDYLRFSKLAVFSDILKEESQKANPPKMPPL